VSTPKDRLWFYGTRTAALTLPLVFVGLVLAVALLRALLGWPGYELDQTLLLGIFALSMLPLLLAVMDALVERRGVVKLPWAEFDFSHVAAVATPTVVLPVNIGVAGEPLNESNVTLILDALRSTEASEVVIVDLEGGNAWWETRLLLLLAGATRTGRPSKVVFLAMEGAVAGRFQGWAPPGSLLPILLRADPLYALCYHRAAAAARAWAAVEPVPPAIPPPPPWVSGLVGGLGGYAFDPATGLPNELAPEQMLAAELGREVEQKGPPREITLARLEELFRPVLLRNAVDETWPADRQLAAFFEDTAPQVAVTSGGRYLRLLPRDVALSAIVRSLAIPAKEK
jgi:hypothetical protein